MKVAGKKVRSLTEALHGFMDGECSIQPGPGEASSILALLETKRRPYTLDIYVDQPVNESMGELSDEPLALPWFMN